MKHQKQPSNLTCKNKQPVIRTFFYSETDTLSFDPDKCKQREEK